MTLNLDGTNPKLVHICELGARTVGICVTLLGLAVLFGWFLNIDMLKSIRPELASMKFNTALLFVFSGILVTFHHMPTPYRYLMGAVIIILATLTLAQDIFGWQLSIDELIITDVKTRLQSGVNPGRMSVMTAVSFMLVGSALVLLHPMPIAAQGLAIIIGIIALLALVGYMYNVNSLYSIVPFSSMALHTACSFLATSIAILAQTTDYSFMKTSVSDTAGGVVIRWLLPLSFAVIIGSNLLRFQGQYMGLYDFAFGAAIVTVFVMVVLAIVIIYIGNYLHQVDLKRLNVEAALQQSHSELEQRVIERTAQLEHANKELEAFSYSISHDLRAPLRAISGFFQIIAEDYEDLLPQEGRESLDIISKEVNRLENMIEKLLIFSRFNQVPLNKATVDMNALVADVLNELHDEQSGRDIEFIVGDLPSANADEALLHQVLTNLISNALKYTRNNSHTIIEVGYDKSPSETIYFVKDNGVGFNMDYAKKLFGVFQRMHSESQFEGTGVGLSIVARIIHRHGGRVWADAEVNKGATFYFTLEPDSSILTGN
ncbi:hypothetical protein G4Y79_11510 [Phototrophicus methaneseepsis]|uniref:histidine kinase n=1 Tax=Phototrophicus methaneseepsis TaxID=2710758 RepID=A0A7S8EDG7_9CHLR|nr:ATP-binding protein [Phototrophicus methaneseepsis]QPC84963.1 hypothetical protein G4Y79_11510 [Phototrophicus methaneseepsis]